MGKAAVYSFPRRGFKLDRHLVQTSSADATSSCRMQQRLGLPAAPNVKLMPLSSLDPEPVWAGTHQHCRIAGQDKVRCLRAGRSILMQPHL